MKISVVVPTLNSESDIKRLLQSIEDNNIAKDIELIVADADSHDNTLNIVNQYNFTKVINVGLCPRGKARNEGVINSSNEIIAIIDSDTELLPGWVDAILDSLVTRNFEIVAGYSPNPNGDNLPRVPMLVNGQDITWPFCNIAFKRSVFVDVGLFCEYYTKVPDDCDYNIRCIKKGYTIYYNPKMKLYHHERSTFIKFCKQSYWNGYFRKGLRELYPELKLSQMHNIRFKSLIRLGFGAIGYVTGDYRRKKGEKHK